MNTKFINYEIFLTFFVFLCNLLKVSRIICTVNDRIREVREVFCGGSNKKFAEVMEEKANTTSNWVRDNYSVGRGVLSKISEKFSVNIHWLLTGEGSMCEKSENMNFSVDKQGIPLISVDAVAGFVGGDVEGIRYEDYERYNIPDFTIKGVEFLIRVSGSSMYPKYSNGDLLACKRIYDMIFFQWGKIYVIDSSQGSLVKRIYEDKDNKDNVICESENKKKYPPFSMPKSDIRSLSIVLGVVRLE